MEILKKIEAELILDWQSLQEQRNLGQRAKALVAYNIKYKAFKKSQAWHLELQLPLL